MTLFDAEDAGDRSSSVAGHTGEPSPAGEPGDAGDRSSSSPGEPVPETGGDGRADPLAGDRKRTRLRMTVAYDGAGFHGFAYNPGVGTVAGALREALAKVLGQDVELTCAGRTDKGVHAWGQVVHFDLTDAGAGPSEAPAEAAVPAPEGAPAPAVADGPDDHTAPAPGPDLVGLQRSLNRMLAPRIVVREVDVALPGFDARRAAIGRRYRYSVLNRPLPDPFLAGTTWHVPEPLDLRAMQLACDPLIGEHDWSSFCRKPPALSPRAGPQARPPRQAGDPGPAGAVLPSPREGSEPLDTGQEASLVRVVRHARWLDLGDGLLRFDIEANAFCHQMVRSLVGTLVAVGRGRLRAGDIGGVLRSRDRALAAQPAPPYGLCLWEALYPPNPST